MHVQTAKYERSKLGRNVPPTENSHVDLHIFKCNIHASQHRTGSNSDLTVHVYIKSVSVL